VIGHQVGADFKLARWETIVGYFDQLHHASDRVNVRRLDSTTEGNAYLFVEISSAQTMRQLERYRALQSRLADPRLIKGETERAGLLRDAKTTIVMTCSLHSSECAGAQMAMELTYDLAARNDARTREILDSCIILLVPSANPDGHNKIIDWYERYLGTPYEGARMPWLYQKYAGHDNNRDWFMLNLKETRILTEIMYHEWHPTVSYDVHQMGSRGARFFVPPFYDPVNPNVDPLIHQSLLLIGGHMATDLQEHAKTGVVNNAIFDNWWQGGNRTTPYRHNIVGILTEAASANIASPKFLDFGDLQAGSRGFRDHQATVNFAEPWTGGWWRLRDIVDYELIASKALFTLAARYRDRFVKNHLTLSEKALEKGREEAPFAWLVPADQRDPGAAATMLDVLLKSGIEVQRAIASFQADGRSYPPGTFVLLGEQPYRPHLKDMMERQVLPEGRQRAGEAPEAPYDSAGWTLPVQMGVRSLEVVSPFAAQLERLSSIEAQRFAPTVDSTSRAFITKRQGNSDYAAINALLAQGFDVHVMTAELRGFPVGSIVVSSNDRLNELKAAIQKLSKRFPARFEAVDALPDIIKPMKAPRTALYQPWTASKDEGWTRLVLENFEFPFNTIHNADIRAGSLRDRFDCIIIPSLSAQSILDGRSDKDMPPPYAGGIGPDGALALERFAQQGGTLVLMDRATDLAIETLRVPVRNVLKGVSRDKFQCPGSLLRIRVNNHHALGYGFTNEAAATFAQSRAFVTGKTAIQAEATSRAQTDGAQEEIASPKPDETELDAKVAAHPVTTAASYSDNLLLLSGWIFGEDHIRNRAAICEVEYGAGRIVLFGFRVQFRGQPHGSFKFLFNAIYRSTLGDS